MRIIDAHVHLLDPSWIPECVRAGWARQASNRRFPERDAAELLPRVMTAQADPDGALTLAAFDRFGVEAGIIAVIDWTKMGRNGEHRPIRELNEGYSRLGQACAGRLLHLAGVDPRHDDAAAILAEALAAPHCVGLKLYPAAGWDIDDPANEWLFAELLDRQMPALFHTSPMGGDPLDTPRSRPSALAPLLVKFPTLQVVFGHAGFEAWWLEALDIAHGWQRTYLEVSLWQDLADRDYDEFRKRMSLMIGRLGSHRIIFGSDSMRGHGADADGTALGRWIDRFVGLAERYRGGAAVVDADGLEQMLAGNAGRVYRTRL